MSRTYHINARAHAFVNEAWHATGSWSWATLPTLQVMSAAARHFEQQVDQAVFIGFALLYAKQLATQRENDVNHGDT